VRPLGAGDVITDALRLIRSDFWRMCGVVAVVVVPANVVIAVMIFLFMRHMGRVPYLEADAAAIGVLGYGALLLGGASLWGLVIPFAQVALVRAITDRYLGLRVSIARSWRWVLSNIWTVMGTVVLVALLLLVVLMFVVVPGYVITFFVAVLIGGPLAVVVLLGGVLLATTPFFGAMFLTMFAIPAMVTEDEGGVFAVLRSFRLVLINPLKLLLLVVVTWLLSVTVTSLPGLLMPQPEVVDMNGPTGIFDYYNATALTTALTTALAGLTQSVIRTLRGSIYLLAYFDARCRSEGFDVEFEARKQGVWGRPEAEVVTGDVVGELAGA